MHPVKMLKTLSSCVELFASRNGYLNASGWLKSRQMLDSVNAAGEPIPWITYACLRFLESRVKPDMSVFEFGSGASTFWWAKRVREVVSCEHDREWFDRTRAGLAENVRLIHASREDGQYARQILQFKSAFDIVVIDGRDRVACATNCISSLKDRGIIIWDNTDRDYYTIGYDLLRTHGFRRVDFIGMTPINLFECSTSIFYRDDNCLLL
jgi:hypothetical protein